MKLKRPSKTKPLDQGETNCSCLVRRKKCFPCRSVTFLSIYLFHLPRVCCCHQPDGRTAQTCLRGWAVRKEMFPVLKKLKQKKDMYSLRTIILPIQNLFLHVLKINRESVIILIFELVLVLISFDLSLAGGRSSAVLCMVRWFPGNFQVGIGNEKVHGMKEFCSELCGSSKILLMPNKLTPCANC